MKAINWLKQGLDSLRAFQDPNTGRSVTARLRAEDCIGCGSCVSSCPRQALTLEPDRYGFYVANMDPTKCVNCGLCVRRCPMLSAPAIRNAARPNCYEVIAKDRELLRGSSSGGIFGLLAKNMLAQGGVVCGAAWDELTGEHPVKHIIVESENDLWKIQKSKYVQSYMGDIPQQILREAKTGRPVLFCGTPCQTAGMRAFLGKDYDNVLLVDLFCGNAPSAMFFKKYLADEFPQGVKSYSFRTKEKGWRCDCIEAVTADGEQVVSVGGEQDLYQRVFHSHVMCAPHCEACKFQRLPRRSDLTIGDFWGIEKHEGKDKTANGTSVVLLHNEKGKAAFLALPQELFAERKNVPLEWIGGNGYLFKRHNWASPKRDDFYKAITRMGFLDASNYALKPNHGGLSLSGERRQPVTGEKRFSFESEIWSESVRDGVRTLSVKPASPGSGHFASLPLDEALIKGKRYVMELEFKLKSSSPVLNFHVKDSGTKYHQLIHSCQNPAQEEWVSLRIPFTPTSSAFDEFMIGAAQISGPGNYFALKSLRVFEE